MSTTDSRVDSEQHRPRAQLEEFRTALHEALDLVVPVASSRCAEQAHVVLAAVQLATDASTPDNLPLDAPFFPQLTAAVDQLTSPVSAIRAATSRTERLRRLVELEERCVAVMPVFEELCCLVLPGFDRATAAFRLMAHSEQMIIMRMRADLADDLARLDKVVTAQYRAEEQLVAGYERQLTDYAEKIRGQLTAHDAQLTKQLGKVQQMEERARGILRDVSERSAMKEIEDEQHKQRDEADKWRMIAVVFGVVTFVGLFVLALWGQHLPLSNALGTRLPVVVFASGLFALFVQQARMHRQDERKYRDDRIRMSEARYIADESPEAIAEIKRLILDDVRLDWIMRNAELHRKAEHGDDQAQQNGRKRDEAAKTAANKSARNRDVKADKKK